MVLASAKSHPPEVPPPRPTILVVDDASDIRDVLARLLRLAGYKSLTAEGGEAALASVAAEGPDLIVLDLMMPDMSGLEVLRRLRADPRYSRLPVVMFTAVGDRAVAEEARRLGVSDIIVKGGMGARELLDRISSHLH